MPLIVSAAVPLLVRVSVWVALGVPSAWFPKLTLPGPDSRLMPNVTDGAVPVPESATVRGLPAPLSAITRPAARGPAAAGRNRTRIAVIWPGASVVLPAANAAVKSAALAPVTATATRERGAVPLFFRV